MRAKVNPEMCDGTGLCEQICPEVFELKEGISTVKIDDVPFDSEQSCREAAENCPKEAISIEG
jgi:ferredoxin